MFLSVRGLALTFAFAALILTGCSGTGRGGISALVPEIHPAGAPDRRAHGHKEGPIAHIVVLVQENRSFDNLFATFPGADGATTGKLHSGKIIPLAMHPLISKDVNHDYTTYETDYDGGKMDGFNESLFIHTTKKAGTYPYRYVNPDEVQPYWTLAEQYALADHMFQTQGSGSFTAHQDLIAGATAIDSKQSLIDWPTGSPWGCGAPPKTVTSLITTTGQYRLNQGPFPCLKYPTGTIRDLLDAKGVSWKYYAPVYKVGAVGVLWNAFAAIGAVYNGPEWKTNISIPETNIFTDISGNQLPAVSWVIPNQDDSDHPSDVGSPDDGPSWVAQIVNAIGGSKYWNSTAIVVVWDDWGGFYDHEPPAFLDDAGGLGFRVPMIVVSPYIPAGTIDHTQYEFGSILKFIEEKFDLGSLGTTDARATSVGTMLNLSQPPRKFRPIPSLRSRSYFLHRRPSYAPVDSE